MHVTHSNGSLQTDANLSTKSTFQMSLSTIQTTSKTLGTKGVKKEDEYWLTHIAIFGIATAVLIICILIAIIASRVRSLRKANAQYEKQRQQALEETLKQKRDSELRLYSRSRTSTQSTEAFYIQDYEHHDGFNDAVFGGIIHYDECMESHPPRSPFVQAIPAFSKAVNVTVGNETAGRILETPPPRLSPSFQSSAERYGIGLLPPRRHSVMTLHPEPAFETPETRQEEDGPPPILPREPIKQATLPNHRMQKKQERNGHYKRKRAHSLFDNIENKGYIPEETENPVADRGKGKSIPEPDYPGA